ALRRTSRGRPAALSRRLRPRRNCRHHRRATGHRQVTVAPRPPETPSTTRTRIQTMKTPRDLLLERHRDQSPALHQLRERVIAQVYGADPATVRQSRTGLQPVSERTDKVAPTPELTAHHALASTTIGRGVLPSEAQPTFVAPAGPAGDRL